MTIDALQSTHGGQRAGAARRAARSGHRRGNTATLRAAGSRDRDCRRARRQRTLRAVRAPPEDLSSCEARRGNLSASRGACRAGWSTSSPRVIRTARLRTGSTASPSSSRSRAARRSAVSTCLFDRRTRAHRADESSSRRSRGGGGGGGGGGGEKRDRTRARRRRCEGKTVGQRSRHRSGAMAAGDSERVRRAAGHFARHFSRWPRFLERGRRGIAAGQSSSRRRFAPPCLAPMSRRSTHVSRGLRGGSSGGPAHVRAALRRVPLRQSHRARHADRRGARVAGSRRFAGPPKARSACLASEARAGCRADRSACRSVSLAGNGFATISPLLDSVTIGGTDAQRQPGVAGSGSTGGFGPSENAPVVREVVEAWLRRHGNARFQRAFRRFVFDFSLSGRSI